MWWPPRTRAAPGSCSSISASAKPLLSYFQFNEAKRSEEIIERLRRGEKVALVTDAGSPGISDPGERVVKAAIAAGFRVEAVPVRARWSLG